MKCKACGRPTSRLRLDLFGRPRLFKSTRVIRFYSRSKLGIVTWSDPRLATLPIQWEIICNQCANWSDWRHPFYGLVEPA